MNNQPKRLDDWEEKFDELLDSLPTGFFLHIDRKDWLVFDKYKDKCVKINKKVNKLKTFIKDFIKQEKQRTRKAVVEEIEEIIKDKDNRKYWNRNLSFNIKGFVESVLAKLNSLKEGE